MRQTLPSGRDGQPHRSSMNHEEIKRYLRDPDPAAAGRLYGEADRVRRENVGDAVYLRGLVEISNHCRRLCGYCGVNAGRVIERYRMTREEILAAARQARDFGYGTLVVQAGEDPALTRDWIGEVVRAVKDDAGLAVTLSLGERDDGDYAAWRRAGADRYLLRFETSDPVLFDRLHPPLPGREGRRRLEILARLRDLGYEVGSGIMVGLPGQTWDSLADDIGLFQRLDLDMIGIGPYLSHPETAMALHPECFPSAPDGEQAKGDEDTVCRVVALARLMQPKANIPATTAVALVNRESGREHALARGANVVMPNLTPARYRRLYEIYPAKAHHIETAEAVNDRIARQLAALGRTLGRGHGDSPNKMLRG